MPVKAGDEDIYVRAVCSWGLHLSHRPDDDLI